MTSAFTISDDKKSITCHKCGNTSQNPDDVKNEYCGFCHKFHDMMDKNMNTHRVKKSVCPTCGYEPDCGSRSNSPEGPEPGDIGLCFKCGEVLVYGEDGGLTIAGLDDTMGLSEKESAALDRIQALIRSERPVP